MANAALHVEVEALREGAANTDVKVDAATVQQAAELRDRMLKTAEHNLGHKDSVARELADILLETQRADGVRRRHSLHHLRLERLRVEYRKYQIPPPENDDVRLRDGRRQLP